MLRAFLRRENVPEEETETLVGKVKEKKMKMVKMFPQLGIRLYEVNFSACFTKILRF